MKGSLSAKKISGKTGRSAQVLLNDERTYHQVVQRFVEALGKSSSPASWWGVLLGYPVAWRTVFEMGKARSVGLQGTYYRSRRFTANDPIPSVADLGPPPAGKQGEGRYSDGRHVVLYLARTERVAALESDANPAKPKVFIQQFELYLPKLKVLRLSQDLEATAPVLQYLLIESEYLPEESSLPNPYRPTQFIAFLCRLRGIFAVEYPSVRAGYKEDSTAVNMVIFSPAVEEARTMSKGSPFEYHASLAGTHGAG